jgi:hypothetical protein
MTPGSRREPAKVCCANLSQDDQPIGHAFRTIEDTARSDTGTKGGVAMLRSPLRRLVTLALILGTAGCSSTKVVNTWENPQYVPARFTRILVIGVSQQASVRRAFEDAFVTRLKAEGVDAVPSYLFIAEDDR